MEVRTRTQIDEATGEIERESKRIIKANQRESRYFRDYSSRKSYSTIKTRQHSNDSLHSAKAQ